MRSVSYNLVRNVDRELWKTIVDNINSSLVMTVRDDLQREVHRQGNFLKDSLYRQLSGQP